MASKARTKGIFGTALAVGVVLGLAVPTPSASAAATMACEDDSGLCLTPLNGARWEPGQSSTAKDRKRRTTKGAGTLSVNIEGGRGSVFLNGRYAGTAPLTAVEIPRGKNDLQVRDGATVLASGLLTVPPGGDVEVAVAHD
jgi:hypothetical protein